MMSETPTLHHPAIPTLHAFADDELMLPEASAVERHVAECASCADTVRAVRELRAVAQSVPQSITPPTPLWAAIAQRTVFAEQNQSETSASGLRATPMAPAETSAAPSAHAVPSRARRLALAATVMLCLSLAGYAALHGTKTGNATAPPSRSAQSAPATAFPPARAPLPGRTDVIDDATAASRAADLAALEQAVDDAARANRAHPDNAHLESMLLRARAQENAYRLYTRSIVADM